MSQPSLFEDGGAVESPDLPDADLTYLPGFFGSDADRLLAEVQATTAWRQDTFRIYGKEMPIPRLNAWYGEPGCVYTYSKIELDPLPWTGPLVEIKERIEPTAGGEFNSVLVNLYRDGADSVAWHSDDEPELGTRPVIASVSLGASRSFHLRHKELPDVRHRMRLEHGSLLVMRGTTQRHWQHQVPKTKASVGPRINLTYRLIA